MDDIADLVRRFEDQSWPLEDWHHRQHLIVATWYLTTLPFEEASRRIREGIQAYNARHGIAQTPQGGYHETLTVALIRLIRREIAAGGSDAAPAAFEPLPKSASIARRRAPFC